MEKAESQKARICPFGCSHFPSRGKQLQSNAGDFEYR